MMLHWLLPMVPESLPRLMAMFWFQWFEMVSVLSPTLLSMLLPKLLPGLKLISMWLEQGNSCKHGTSLYSLLQHLGQFCKAAHKPHNIGQRPSFGNLKHVQIIKFLKTHSAKLLIIYLIDFPNALFSFDNLKKFT